MRKYLSLILSSIFAILAVIEALVQPIPFPLQIPTAYAANKVIQCTCDKPNLPDIIKNGNLVRNNSYYCGPAGQGTYSDRLTGKTYIWADGCAHQEQACVPNAKHQFVEYIAGQGNVTFAGVSCPNVNATKSNSSITCSCSGNTDIHGYKGSITCTNNVTHTTQTQSCGGYAVCVVGSNLSYSGFSNQSVNGIGCEQDCRCINPGKTGPGNNGWKCYAARGKLSSQNSGYCPNQEDYCTNDKNSTNGVKCVNSTKCTCQNDHIVCTSNGSGGSGQNESFTYACPSGTTCKSGKKVNDPNFNAFNQHISGVACQKVPVPPPPSPPCYQWNSGQCQKFATGLGKLATDPSGFIKSIFGLLLSLSGGIALLLIIRAGYQLMTSQGNPEQIKQGRDQLIAAIVGLVFLIFSFVFLQVIGYDILHIPGFGK